MINCQVRSAPIWLEDERRFRFLVAGCNGTNTIFDKHGSHTRSQWYTSTDGVQWVHEDNAGSNGLAVGVDGVYMVVYVPRQPFLFMLYHLGSTDSLRGAGTTQTTSRLRDTRA